MFGRSFLTAGLIMALLAIPLIVGATREALAQVPAHVREASYALGKTKATTIRRVLLPSVRPSIASGITLGMGRIIGDTAIVVILLGASLHTEPAGGPPVLSILRGTGSTLTSYVKENSPAGEGNAPQKAYAAAFVLLVIVIVLNAIGRALERRPESAGRRTMTAADATAGAGGSASATEPSLIAACSGCPPTLGRPVATASAGPALAPPERRSAAQPCATAAEPAEPRT